MRAEQSAAAVPFPATVKQNVRNCEATDSLSACACVAAATATEGPGRPGEPGVAVPRRGGAGGMKAWIVLSR